MNSGQQASRSAPSSLHGGRKSSKSRGWHSTGPSAAGPWAATQRIPVGRAGEERQVIQVTAFSPLAVLSLADQNWLLRVTGHFSSELNLGQGQITFQIGLFREWRETSEGRWREEKAPLVWAGNGMAPFSGLFGLCPRWLARRS